MNILVTGGSGGLSKAVVETLARDANNNVYFTYASSAYVAEQIVAAHANVTAVRGDFTDSGQLEDLSRQMLGWDVLVNNTWAGKPEGIHFHKLTQEALLRSFTNNVLPTVSVTQKALETFCEKKSGRIITVLTSYVVGVPPLGYSLYASTKAYLAQMAKSWAKEYGKMGITSNCVSPEFMRTGFTVGTDTRVIEQMEASHPLKRLLRPQDVADVIASLAYASPHLNGVNIPINAGMQMI